MKVELNLEKATKILGYPDYYVIESRSQVDDDAEMKLRIWIVRDEKQKELLPNVNGKILMKNDKGAPVPLMYMDVIRKVEAAINEGLAKQYVKKKSEDEGLDPEIVKLRNKLKFEYFEIKSKVKSSKSAEETLELKEEFFKKEAALESFYVENPNYRTYKEIQKRKRIKSVQELKYDAMWKAHCEEDAEFRKNKKDKEKSKLNLVLEIIAKFGKKTPVLW